MNASELRRAYMKFFEKRGHRIMRSDALVPPAEDKSLLFTGAGMNKFKAEFMGRGEPGLTRAVTSQKCLRTGDIDNVGRTAWHLTFFEMLGNFSFGDYFKREAIIWAWEFLTEELKIPARNLQVSVYEEDEEAYGIWEKDIGLAAGVIHRFGQHDNFWPADCPKNGPNGLCGPCSEIFYDWGADSSHSDPNSNPSTDSERFCEIWNLVFQQFDRQTGGTLTPLPTKNIDTGMGLERTAAVLQGKKNNFDADLFVPVIQAVERETDRGYEDVRDSRLGVAFRRIADHVRAGAFCINDGILPDNTGRGYVLRKLLRRAILDGRRLEMHEPWLYRLVPVVVQVMQDQYPDLIERRENVARLIRIEEERFMKTLDQGMGILQDMVAELRRDRGTVLAGDEVFRLFDTFGLPIDVTESILEDEGMSLDREAFERELERQREQSRQGTKIADNIFGGGPVAALREKGATSEFVGYDEDVAEAHIGGIILGEELVDVAREGDNAVIVLDRTTFYAESGGEVGDMGVLANDDATFDVADTQTSEGLVLHVGKVRKGELRVGDPVSARADVARRACIRRNHTATHLLHHALRDVLGDHAQQSGSYVGPDHLRFDFTHMQAVSHDEVRLVETKVNEYIVANMSCVAKKMSLEEARERGAMALFGEKYSDVVRMLDIGGLSKELCGGLHCAATGDIGLFKITSESSVAAGIRRIEAVTGGEAIHLVHEKEDLLRATCAILASQETQLPERAEQLQKQIKDLRKEVQRARQSSAPSAGEYLANAQDMGGAKIVVAKIDDATADDLRALTDSLRKEADSVGIVLAGAPEGKVILVVAFSKDLVDKGCHAGKIAGAAAKLCGGGGGGRPDMAQAGGKNPDGIAAALAQATKLIGEALS